MKTQYRLIKTQNSAQTPERCHSRPERRAPKAALLAAAGALVAAQSAMALPDIDARPHVGTVFVIAMENHNFTQPDPTNSPQQILGNPAAPFINSLVTPGNSNAAQVSFATTYLNAGVGVHPSEPNYVWAEAGSDFGVHTDADPAPTNNNTFYDQSNHLTAQLNCRRVSWKNYQEDVQLSASPTNSASGTNGPVNPYYGNTQFNYAVKHNPMAFFADTAVANVYPLSQLFADLGSNAVARYNWITPNQFDDAHSALKGGFTYLGTHYTGDQAAVAQGDNFLATIVPQIMATDAYKDNGVIIIWWDETEDGDGTNRAIPEIIISPLARGNAYASSVPMNHSSDIKTLEEIFHLPNLNNPIPVNETNNAGSYNNVALVNDLSDLFQPGVIPAAPQFTVTAGPIIQNRFTHHFFQFVDVRNAGPSIAGVPVFLVLDNLSPNATLLNADGTSAVLGPIGSPFVRVATGDCDGDLDDFLFPAESRFVALEFLDPTGQAIAYDSRVLSVTPTP